VRPYLKKLFTKIRLVEWFKVKALSSNPSTEKKAEEHELIKETQLMHRFLIIKFH
jgi:hypothetical protein